MTEIKGRWSKLGAASAVTAVAGAGVMLFALNPTSSQAAADKVTICHRTNSNSNPYVVIAPSASGVFHGHLKNHTGPIWNDTLKADGIKWGDIIPPFSYKGATYSQNWTSDGQAIWENGCNIPAAPESSEPASSEPASSEPASSSASVSPTETVTDTAVVEPTSPGPVPAGVAAGQHSVSSTSVALGGVLMAVGVGGLLTAVRPWKRGSH